MFKRLSFLKRASLTLHKTAQKLFKIMEDKKSNLCLAIDVSSQRELFDLADALGPFICTLKTHVDILEDFTPDFGKTLRKISEKHRFLIFEDRKFADIGKTVSLQYAGGLFRIADWADLVNAHIISGPEIISALKGASLLLLAEMNSTGTLAKGAYTKAAVALGEKYKESVIGFICLKNLSRDPGMIHFTPGVKFEPGKDALGQRQESVEEVLIKNKSDIIIVGHDIICAANPQKQAALYRERSWRAYEKSLA